MLRRESVEHHLCAGRAAPDTQVAAGGEEDQRPRVQVLGEILNRLFHLHEVADVAALVDLGERRAATGLQHGHGDVVARALAEDAAHHDPIDLEGLFHSVQAGANDASGRDTSATQHPNGGALRHDVVPIFVERVLEFLPDLGCQGRG